MGDQSTPVASDSKPQNKQLSVVEQAQLILAKLMEGGQEDDETCQTLDELTKLFKDDADSKSSTQSICDVVDDVCVDTILGYLDMRQTKVVRSHAILTAAAYLGAAGQKGTQALRKFFLDRVQRGTYDDYIVAFCVAADIFPVAPAVTTEMFLSEGFLPSLSPLMRRRWKSRKVETACLEMLNVAASYSDCRPAIRKYCQEWLDEIATQNREELPGTVHAADPGVEGVEASSGSIALRKHSRAVHNLAVLILAKLTAVPVSPTEQTTRHGEDRVQPVTTSIEELSSKLTSMLLTDPDNSKKLSVEGLAYATIKPTVMEEVAHNDELLKTLVNILVDAPAKSALTFGCLSIFMNLTRYRPVQSEEQKNMSQLKAYANAAGHQTTAPNPLSDDDHVAGRCLRVFEAGVVPVLVTHSRHGSSTSLSVIVSILFSLSVNTSLRGRLAQQGAVNLLIAAWSALPDTDDRAKRTASQALARILISTNPSLVFGGTRARPQNAAIRPLVSLLSPDPAADTRDLLPSFEALMALTNLASTDDDTRAMVIRVAFQEVEEQLYSSNHLVSKAATELICNLVQCVEGIALYAADTPQAANRLHILLALTDAEDEATRSAAGGALASLTAYEEVVRGVLKRNRGVELVLGLCGEDKEDLRHRGVFIIFNLVSIDGEVGSMARKAIREKNGLEILKTCAKKSRTAEVVEVTVQSLKILLEED
ncbi:putative actin cytoskeleton organization protein [Xylaria nigripes]|nr:putative actin cytoskeleton organization protein [Xylaria nigripes]